MSTTDIPTKPVTSPMQSSFTPVPLYRVITDDEHGEMLIEHDTAALAMSDYVWSVGQPFDRVRLFHGDRLVRDSDKSLWRNLPDADE